MPQMHNEYGFTKSNIRNSRILIFRKIYHLRLILEGKKIPFYSPRLNSTILIPSAS